MARAASATCSTRDPGASAWRAASLARRSSTEIVRRIGIIGVTIPTDEPGRAPSSDHRHHFEGISMNFTGILIGSDDPQRLVDYYARLLGEPTFRESGYTGWALGTGWLTIGAHSEVSGKNAHPGRIIWNLESADVKRDFERFRAAGATVVAEPYGADEGDQPGWIATFADPDDNYFQLMSPMAPS